MGTEPPSKIKGLALAIGLSALVTGGIAGAGWAADNYLGSGYFGGGAADAATSRDVEPSNLEGWDPLLAPYVEFVETARGLTFSQVVPVERVDIATALADDGKAPAEAAFADDELGYDPYTEAYVLLGLLDTERQLADAQSEVLETSAAAFYDLEEQAIFLPVDVDNPSVVTSIVHELTHALQDQHGLLDFPELESITGARLRLGLVEGDASRIENQWFDAQPLSKQREIEDAWAEFEGPTGPGDYISTSFYGSYALGEPVVEILIETQGIDAFDRLLGSENLGTDERLVDPLTDNIVRSPQVRGQIQDPDGNQWYDGSIGAFGFYHVLASELGHLRAFEAVAGFGDDVFVTWEEAGRICARYDVHFDSDDDAELFAAELAELGADSESIGTTGVRFDRCEPLIDPDGVDDSLLTALVVRNYLLLEHVDAGVEAGLARCAVDVQIISLGPDAFDEPARLNWYSLIDTAPDHLASARDNPASTRACR